MMAQDQTNAICKDTNKVDEQSTEYFLNNTAKCNKIRFPYNTYHKQTQHLHAMDQQAMHYCQY